MQDKNQIHIIAYTTKEETGMKKNHSNTSTPADKEVSNMQEKSYSTVCAIYDKVTTILALVLSLLLAVGVFYLNRKTAGESFEEHLLLAKKAVAQEIGYSGSLDSDSFTIASDHTYVIYKNGIIADSGTFKDSTAIKELDEALRHNNHHQDAKEASVDSFLNRIDLWASAIITFFLAICVATLFTTECREPFEKFIQRKYPELTNAPR